MAAIAAPNNYSSSVEEERVEKEMKKKVKWERKEKKAREARMHARMMEMGQVRLPEDCST